MFIQFNVHSFIVVIYHINYTFRINIKISGENAARCIISKSLLMERSVFLKKISTSPAISDFIILTFSFACRSASIPHTGVARLSALDHRGCERADAHSSCPRRCQPFAPRFHAAHEFFAVRNSPR